MNELTLLKSMWAEKIKRKTDLIVPRVTHDGKEGSLNNESWAFTVPYAFRDALNIAYEERKKDKKPYMVWTQGPILSFKEGDLVHSKDGCRAVQISFARPMTWDSAKNAMHQGSVVYSEYVLSGNAYSKLHERSCSQMQFLQLLIQGSYDS